MSNYNVKYNLFKYARNDTIITLKLYKELSELCHLIAKCDTIKMSTALMMANCGFMLNMHDNVL